VSDKHISLSVRTVIQIRVVSLSSDCILYLKNALPLNGVPIWKDSQLRKKNYVSKCEYKYELK